jgi:cystathionine beta-lyase/cystathionine gamma-synthase
VVFQNDGRRDTTLYFTYLKAGEHLILFHDVYGANYKISLMLERWGNTCRGQYLCNPVPSGSAETRRRSCNTQRYKRVGGDNDLMAGVIAASEEHYDTLWFTRQAIGTTLDASSGSLLERGIKTFDMRCEKMAENALAMADVPGRASQD